VKIEIRKSFIKDADKLPAPFQRQLAIIIETMKTGGQPNQLPDCKSSQVIKLLIV